MSLKTVLHLQKSISIKYLYIYTYIFILLYLYKHNSTVENMILSVQLQYYPWKCVRLSLEMKYFPHRF